MDGWCCLEEDEGWDHATFVSHEGFGIVKLWLNKLSDSIGSFLLSYLWVCLDCSSVNQISEVLNIVKLDFNFLWCFFTFIWIQFSGLKKENCSICVVAVGKEFRLASRSMMGIGWWGSWPHMHATYCVDSWHSFMSTFHWK